MIINFKTLDFDFSKENFKKKSNLYKNFKNKESK